MIWKLQVLEGICKHSICCCWDLRFQYSCGWHALMRWWCLFLIESISDSELPRILDVSKLSLLLFFSTCYCLLLLTLFLIWREILLDYLFVYTEPWMYFGVTLACYMDKGLLMVGDLDLILKCWVTLGRTSHLSVLFLPHLLQGNITTLRPSDRKLHL